MRKGCIHIPHDYMPRADRGIQQRPLLYTYCGAEEGCESLKWHFRRHPDGGEQRKLGVAGRVWHVRCACPVDTWPCRQMADEDAMSDVPAADPLPAPVTDAGEEHEEESDANNGDNGSRSPGRARAKKPRGSKSRRKRR